jgi:hypothetical protein
MVKVYMEYTGGGVNKRPGWKKLPKAAQQVPLDYHREWTKEFRMLYVSEYDEYYANGVHNYYYVSGPIDSSLFAESSHIPGVIEGADYLAKNKLFDQLKGEGTNIANMFAERKQAVKSIENLLSTIVYTVRDLKRGNVSSAIRRMGGDPLSARKLRAKDISQQWLSLQYGWLPMMSDVYGIVNGLHKRETTLPKVFRCASRFRDSQPSQLGWTIYPGTSDKCGKTVTEANVRYTIAAFPDIALAEPAALGLTNPLVPLWEIVPWSFVVDWFLPVGNYLEQLSAAHGWNFAWGCKSVLRQSGTSAQYDRHFSGSFGGGNTWTYHRQMQGFCDRVEFSRSTLTGFPSVSLPRFKNPLSLRHIENGLALLHGMTGRGGTPPRFR